MSLSITASTSAPSGQLQDLPLRARQHHISRRQPLQLQASASDSSQQANERPYKYTSTDGKPKATMEDAWGARGDAPEATQSAPWSLGWQMNERNTVWSDDMKTRFVKHIAAKELDVKEDEMDMRLRELLALLPGFEKRLAGMSPHTLAQLAVGTPRLAQTLLELKLLFPKANAAQMVVRRTSLVLSEDIFSIRASASRLRALLPDVDLDRLVEEHPSVLDVEALEGALGEARRMMPGVDLQKMMATSPTMIFGFQRGAQLIPYDEPHPPAAR